MHFSMQETTVSRGCRTKPCILDAQLKIPRVICTPASNSIRLKLTYVRCYVGKTISRQGSVSAITGQNKPNGSFLHLSIKYVRGPEHRIGEPSQKLSPIFLMLLISFRLTLKGIPET
ncbi:hypothetical protein SAY86_016213 [Trapa natans]|uniref:Uncharacterized protein n=1 Tax=Trapa natans TaxID=22666 RepID=A0AAN7L9Y6_TRANT|nr:hypothetical protein SAY86_016213 [Trapa natans]